MASASIRSTSTSAPLGLESNPVVKPEDFNASTAPAVNPYNFQEHLYDKSRPENLDFLKRLRALMDEYPGKTTVGEIGDSQHQLEVMAQYTSGDRSSCTWPTPSIISAANSIGRAISRSRSPMTEKPMRPTAGFASPSPTTTSSAMSAAGPCMGRKPPSRAWPPRMILAMRGSVCLYQGEELGLKEAELAFEDLVDPYGIEFWPEFKGRDGCRTPMVWQAHVRQRRLLHRRTSTWLPVPAEHLLHAVDTQDEVDGSVLEFYRALLDLPQSSIPRWPRAVHRAAAIATGDVLAFIRAMRAMSACSASSTWARLRGRVHRARRAGPGTTSAAPASLAAVIDGAIDLEPFGSYTG
jgi:alpha-glucosidase